VPYMALNRDFVTKNGIITEGTGIATSSTNNFGIIQSGGGIAAEKNIFVGTTATVFGEMFVYSTTTLQQVIVNSITATSLATFPNLRSTNAIITSGTITVTSLTVTNTATLADLVVNNIFAIGNITGNNVGVINTATNLQGGDSFQVPYQLSSGTTVFTGPGVTGSVLVGRTSASPTFTNILSLSGNIEATSTSTGTLVVTGGVGVGKNLHVGGTINGNLAGGTTGSILIQTATNISYWLGIGPNAFVLGSDGTRPFWQSLGGLSAGTAFTATNVGNGSAGQVVYQSTSGVSAFAGPGNTGEILVSRGIDGPVFQNTLTLSNTQTSLSTSTGAFQVKGGAGFGRDVYIGGTLALVSTASSTSTPATNALNVSGGAYFRNNLVVDGTSLFKGNVVFSGTATYAYSTNTVFTDNLINLHVPSGSTGADHTWTFDDGKSLGFIFHHYKSGQDRDGFLGFDNGSGYLEWFNNGFETGGIFTGTSYGTFRTGQLILVGGQANNGNTTSGALQVLGGIGVTGNITTNGTITNTNNQQSTSSNSGAFVVTGGVGIGQNLNVAGTSTLGITTSSQSITAFVSNNASFASYTSFAITNNIQQVLDTFSSTLYRTSKYTIQIVDGASFHAQEILMIHNGTNVFKTDYAVITNNGELGVFDADISGGNCRLLFTAFAATSMVVKLARITIAV